MPKIISVGNKSIGDGCPVFLISEVGSNHNQKISIAKELIDVSAEAGADAVKFQLFNTDALYKPGDELYPIFKSIELNQDWLQELIDYTRSKGLIFFASPFDVNSIKALEQYDIPLYKWASSETTNLKNLKIAAGKGKPIIISTGMCDTADVYEALQVCYSSNNENVILLHCSSLYPTKPDQINLNIIDTLRNTFQVIVGFSDHSLGNIASIAAVGKGAKVIEKHITLDKKMGGPDHFYAIEPEEYIDFVKSVRIAEECMGSNKIEMHPEVKKIARREGIYAKVDIEKGQTITKEMVTIKRPALGLRQRYKNAVIGLKPQKSIRKDEPINWDCFDE
jgi:sialic acid synthase SpsE